jgi:dolichol kinase
MQKARRQAFHLRGIALRLLVGIRFQVLFTPLAGVLFTFPSRYLFTIGRLLVFSLAEWSPRIPTGFLVPRGTQGIARSSQHFRLRGYHTLWPVFPDRFD